MTEPQVTKKMDDPHAEIPIDEAGNTVTEKSEEVKESER